MSISRAIANVVTFGAVSKVDKAAESYNRTIAQYNEYKNLGGDIKELQSAIKSLQKKLNRKESIIRKIYTNPKTRERLSNVEIKAINEYKSCAKNIAAAPSFSSSAFGYWDWEDSLTENLSMIIATSVIPIGGQIGAHENADEKVAEIQAKEKEVLEAINKIKPQVLQMAKIKEQCKLAIQTLSTVKSVVEQYGNI